MSMFEAAVLSWYSEHVNPFALETGLVREEFMELGLRGPARWLFLRGLNLIHTEFAKSRAAETNRLEP